MSKHLSIDQMEKKNYKKKVSGQDIVIYKRSQKVYQTILKWIFKTKLLMMQVSGCGLRNI